MGVTDWIQPPDEYRTRPLSDASLATLLGSNTGQSVDPPPWWAWPMPAPPIAPASTWLVSHAFAESTLSYIVDSVPDPPDWRVTQGWGVYAWGAGARDLAPVDPPLDPGARIEWESEEGTWADDELLVVVDGALTPGTPATTVRVAELPATWAPTWPVENSIPLSDWITPSDLVAWPSATGTRPARPGSAAGGTLSLAVPYSGTPRVVIATEAGWVEPANLADVFGDHARLIPNLTTARFRYTPPRYRIHTTGGVWRLRQRQSLTGTDSWPLRQRQNGGHSGSWPLRQRQRGV